MSTEDIQTIDQQIKEISNQMKNPYLTVAERKELQDKINDLNIKRNDLLYPASDDEEDDESSSSSGTYEKKDEYGREKKIDERIALCNNDIDLTGNKWRNYNKITMILLSNFNTIQCYTKEEINHLLNPGNEQLYYWDGPLSSLCCPIKDKKVFRLPFGSYVDDTAMFLNVYKISRLVFKERVKIGSDVMRSSAVSAIHGQEHDIYEIVPLNPVMLFPLMQEIRQELSKKFVDSKYTPILDKYTELIKQKNNLESEIEYKKEEERNILKNKHLNTLALNQFADTLKFDVVAEHDFIEWFKQTFYEVLSDTEKNILDEHLNSDKYNYGIGGFKGQLEYYEKLARIIQNFILEGKIKITISDVDSYINIKKNIGTYNSLDQAMEKTVNDFKEEERIKLTNIYLDSLAITQFLDLLRSSVFMSPAFIQWFKESFYGVLGDTEKNMLDEHLNKEMHLNFKTIGHVRRYLETRESIIKNFIREGKIKLTISDVDSYIKMRKNNGTYDSDVQAMEKIVDDFSKNNKVKALEDVQKKISEVKKMLEPYYEKEKEQREINIKSGEEIVKKCQMTRTQYFQSMLKTVIEKDRKFRYEGVKEDLFTQNDLFIIGHMEKYFNVPYVNYGYIENNNPLMNVNIERFKEIYRQNDVLNHLYNYMFQHNIIVAGGYPSVIIYNGYARDLKDIDIFFYDTPLEKANLIIKTIENMVDTELKFSMKSVTKTTNTITLLYSVKGKVTKLQFILRMYNTKSEILHGFDIGSSAVGFDGKNLLFTSLSKFAYEYGCNVIDTTRRSTTYEERLKKYNNAFTILMPDLDISKLKDDFKQNSVVPFILSFPISIDIKSINGNEIVYDGWQPRKCSFNTEPPSKTESDYLPIMKKEINIRNAITKQYDKIYLSDSKITEEQKPTLEKLLTRSYLDFFKNTLMNKVKSLYYARTWEYRMCNQSSKYLLFSRLYNILPEPELVKQLIDKQELSENIYKEIYRQYILAIKNIGDIPESILQIEWMTKNQMTQLTSSFNPIMKDPEDWYGRYYKYNEELWSLKVCDN